MLTFRLKQHATGIALVLIACLLLQAAMPKGIMAADRSLGSSWLVLCGDVFDLQSSVFSDQDDDRSAPLHDGERCVFSLLCGLHTLPEGAIQPAVFPESLASPTAITSSFRQYPVQYALPLSRAPPFLTV